MPHFYRLNQLHEQHQPLVVRWHSEYVAEIGSMAREMKADLQGESRRDVQKKRKDLAQRMANRSDEIIANMAVVTKHAKAYMEHLGAAVKVVDVSRFVVANKAAGTDAEQRLLDTVRRRDETIKQLNESISELQLKLSDLELLRMKEGAKYEDQVDLLHRALGESQDSAMLEELRGSTKEVGGKATQTAWLSGGCGILLTESRIGCPTDQQADRRRVGRQGQGNAKARVGPGEEDGPCEGPRGGARRLRAAWATATSTPRRGRTFPETRARSTTSSSPMRRARSCSTRRCGTGAVQGGQDGASAR